MKSMTMILAAMTLAAVPLTANASIEVDRNVGTCVNYLILTTKSNAAQRALNMSDNQDRALQFARTKMNEVKRMKDAGNWNTTTQTGFAVEGDRACRNIGIRPGDYQN